MVAVRQAMVAPEQVQQLQTEQQAQIPLDHRPIVVAVVVGPTVPATVVTHPVKIKMATEMVMETARATTLAKVMAMRTVPATVVMHPVTIKTISFSLKSLFN
jgi:hypothetical protein